MKRNKRAPRFHSERDRRITAVAFAVLVVFVQLCGDGGTLSELAWIGWLAWVFAYFFRLSEKLGWAVSRVVGEPVSS